MVEQVDIGIDLGTTFSAVAVKGRVALSKDYGEGIYLEACDVTIIPTPYEEPTFPSILALDPDEGTLVFGTDAAALSDQEQAPIMFSKRKIGTNHEFSLGNGDNVRQLTAQAVAAELLKHIKTCAETALGAEVRRAVITHPAHFDRVAVEQTRQAAIDAGFDMSINEQMVMEPVAAALSYTHDDLSDPLRILTYDLGGGTIDVTYLDRVDGVIEARSFAGDNFLGGFNFDRALATWLLQALRNSGRDVELDDASRDDAPRIARLLQFAETVKLDIARSYPAETDDINDLAPRDVSIKIRGRGVLSTDSGRDIPIDSSITQAQFDDLIRPYLDRTIEHCRRALDRVELNADELDLILLVGGSSRGPWIKCRLADAFPGVECRLFEPDLCVAAGAALHGDLVLPTVVAQSEVKLTLDVSDTIAVDLIPVVGQVSGAPDAHKVRLQTTIGVTLEAALDSNGRFSFYDVELGELGDNAMTLDVVDSNDIELLSHDFTIVYDPDSPATTILTVLPRSLAVETSDGMVVIAEQGDTLPAWCEQSFVRQNSNPTMTLHLFQESDQIGEIRVEDIPAAAGAGSAVTLTVSVNPDGTIEGEIEIKRNGKCLHESTVNVRIAAPDTKSRAELEVVLEAVRSAWSVLTDDQLRAVTRDMVKSRLDMLEQLFVQVPFDHHEAATRLAELEELLTPQSDQMSPTLPTFLADVEQCKQAIDNYARYNADSDQPAPPSDSVAEQRSSHAVKLHDELNRIVDLGEKAYADRDRRAWGSLHASIIAIQQQVRENDPADSPPSASNTRLRASMAITHLMTRLEEAGTDLQQRGIFDDWQHEVRRITEGLARAGERVATISDQMDPRQAIAVCAQLYRSALEPLEQAIANIGVDIAKAGQSVPIFDDGGIEYKPTDAASALDMLAAGKASILERTITADTDLEQYDEDGRSPLMLAAGRGESELVRAFVVRGANVDARSHDGSTALMFTRDVDIARTLIDAGADVNAINNDQISALLYAVNDGSTAAVEYLLNRGADAGQQWKAGMDAVAVAAHRGHRATLAALFRQDASLTQADHQGMSAIHFAALTNNAEIIEFLHESAVDVNTTDNYNRTPIFLAASSGQAEAVAVLVAHGADPLIRRAEDNATPLSIASWSGHTATVAALLTSADPGLQEGDHDGDTALHNAAFNGYIDVMKLLHDAGAKMDTRNDAGQSPLILAVRGAHADAVKWLVQHGANRGVVDNEGKTVEAHAAEINPDLAAFLR